MLKLSVKSTADENFYKEFSEESMKRILMKSMFKMEDLAVGNAAVDQGELRSNITLFPQILSGEYTLVSKAAHSEALEYGTRPFYAPVKPLKEWAARKLGDPNIGYAIQAKIAKEGITAQPFMRPALWQVKNYWLNYYAAVEAKRFK